MDAGFTKGPWRATHSDPAEGVDCWWITANVMDNNGEKEICSVPSGYRSVDANAYLIAAAPELYEALKAALEVLEGATPPAAVFGKVITAARAVLLKAEGK